MEKATVEFTISTQKPVPKSRIECLKEYVFLVAKRVGMIITKTEVK